MAWKLLPLEFVQSLEEMDPCLKKTGLHEQAKYGRLQNAVVEHRYLAPVLLLRQSNEYEFLKNTDKDYVNYMK